MSDLEKVMQDGHALFYVKHQTEEICLAAVKQIGYVLQFVKNQTDEICLAAVKQDGYALRYVEKQTETICLAAVKQHRFALKYVQPSHFGSVSKTLRLRTLFEPELENYIKNMEKEMQI